MKLARLISRLQPAATAGKRDRDVLGIACDSRQVRRGYLFVAVRGEKVDGNTFVSDAIDHGAVAIVSEQELKPRAGATVVRVKDARAALADVSCTFYGDPSKRLRMLGVTGTNGKTTTAYMIRDVLRAHGERPGVISTIDYEVGSRTIPAARTTPEAPVLQSLLAQMVKVGCRSGVMEVSSHALVQQRTRGIDFDVAVFTNLTRDHLDYHGSMEAYFRSKMRLFEDLGRARKGAAAVVNVDDPWGRRLTDEHPDASSLVTYGMDTEALVRAEDVDLSTAGTRFRTVTPWGDMCVNTRLLGRYNVSNMLACVAACGSLGVPLDLQGRVLGKVGVAPGRLEPVPSRLGFQVFVDYAHTDDALENVLSTLRELTSERLIVVFGCGGNRDRSKRPAMGSVASRLADVTVLTSDNPRRESPDAIVDEIRQGCDPMARVDVIVERAAAIRKALSLARKGDIVLIAGKGHETFQEFENTTVPFDDRKVAAKIMEEMT